MRRFARGCKTSPCAASRTSGAMSKMPAKPRRFSRTRRYRHVSSVSCPCSSASTRRAAWFSVLAANQDSMPPLSKAHRISGRPATYPSRAQVLVVSRPRCTSSGSTSTSRLRAMWRQARVATCAIARLAPKRPLWGCMAAAQIEVFGEEGILCCAKHFPGIGDPEDDSHALSIYSEKTREQLDEQLAPFVAAIVAGRSDGDGGASFVAASDGQRNTRFDFPGYRAGHLAR